MNRKFGGSRILIRVLLILSVLGFISAAAVELYISYNSLITTAYRVVSDKIRNPVTVCLLADLHDHRFGEQNARLVSQVNDMEPDLILMAGDFINTESEDSSAATELIGQLTEIAPVYYSLGNQEKGYLAAGTSDLLSEIRAAGAEVLEENYENLEINGNSICLAGMYGYAFAFDGSGHMCKEEMDPDRLGFLEEYQQQEGFKLMMAHRPDSFIFGEAANTWGIDLVVSGHLHGGQVVLPFLGGFYAGDQGFFPKYVYGEHHFNAVKTMIITSGLGSDREFLPRFNNPPEAVVIYLEHE